MICDCCQYANSSKEPKEYPQSFDSKGFTLRARGRVGEGFGRDGCQKGKSVTGPEVWMRRETNLRDESLRLHKKEKWRKFRLEFIVKEVFQKELTEKCVTFESGVSAKGSTLIKRGLRLVEDCGIH